MLNLVTTKTGSGLESNRRLRSFQVPLRRGPSAWFEGALQPPSGSEAITFDLPKEADTVWSNSNITPGRCQLRARRILIPFDFSAASVRLLRWALSPAAQTGTKVSVLHVVHPWAPPVSRHEPFYFEPNSERIEAARSLLRRLLERTCQTPDAVSVHVVVGQVVDEIVRFGQTLKADLIVMVPHGQRGLNHPFLSTTTERATRRASCPTLVVPEPVLQRWEAQPYAPLSNFKRILVLTDLSAGSAAALRYAVGIAEEQRSEVYVLNFSAHGLPRQAAGLDNLKNPKHLANERLAQWIHTQSDRTNAVIPLVCKGKPSVYLLLREAELLKADLLVLGSRGYSWADRLRLTGSRDAILRNAPCPVLSMQAEPLNPGQ